MKNTNNTKRVDGVVTTKQYDRSYAKLKKDHKNDVIEDIDDTVDDLIALKISTQKSNHPLTGTDVNELHIRGDVLLLYRYLNNILTISLHLIDLADHKKLKNPDYQKQIKKTIKNLKENKGDKTMGYMEYYGKDAITTITFNFINKYTNENIRFEYEVPFEVVVEAVKVYFDYEYDVVLKGTDIDIWNMLVDFNDKYDIDIVEDIKDNQKVKEFLENTLKDDAKEKFDELCEEEYQDEHMDDDFEEDE